MKRFETQLTPDLTTGKIRHYWRIFLIDESGSQITLKDGFASTPIEALQAGHKHF